VWAEHSLQVAGRVLFVCGVGSVLFLLRAVAFCTMTAVHRPQLAAHRREVGRCSFPERRAGLVRWTDRYGHRWRFHLGLPKHPQEHAQGRCRLENNHASPQIPISEGKRQSYEQSARYFYLRLRFHFRELLDQLEVYPLAQLIARQSSQVIPIVIIGSNLRVEVD
jgi:hypothetical protein